MSVPVDSNASLNGLPRQFDIILNFNMIHISSNAAVNGLFIYAGRLLKPDGLLITYGPYRCGLVYADLKRCVVVSNKYN